MSDVKDNSSSTVSRSSQPTNSLPPKHSPTNSMNTSHGSQTNIHIKTSESLDSIKTPGKFTRMVTELGKKLSRRSDKEELVSRNIYKEPKIEPPIPAPVATPVKTVQMEKEKEKEKLNDRIQRRPTKADLKLRNILRVDSSESIATMGGPGPSPTFTENSSKLKSILKKRPEKDQLVEKGILRDDKVDRSLAHTAEQLKRSQLTDNLNNFITSRPSPDKVQDKFIGFKETVEIVPTFRKGEYNRRPDANATFRRLTPKLKMEIREELNTYKKTEMPIHEASQSNTAFH